MKISEQWSIERGQDCFIVVERRLGRNPKTGKPTVGETRTYHATVQQCAAKIIKTESLDACTEDHLEDAVARIEQSVNRLAQILEGWIAA